MIVNYVVIRDFWLDEELIALWNYADILDDDEKLKLISKTSNGLERYNRHFKSLFPTDRPALVAFVVTLREEADRIVQRLEDVDKGREVPPDYLEPVFPTIPMSFGKKLGCRRRRGQKRGRGLSRRKLRLFVLKFVSLRRVW
jgi:hypothetical protein